MEHRASQPDAGPAVSEADIALAADALRRGQLVILPTETVYGVFASARSEEATARLTALTLPKSDPPPRYRYTWHAPSVDSVLAAVPVEHAQHRVLIRRLLPGPVRFDLPVPPDKLARCLQTLEAPPGAIDADGVIAFRVPLPATARAVLARAGVPVIANRLGAAGWEPDRDPAAAIQDGRAAREGIEIVLDEGPAQFGVPSTLVRLHPDGGYAVEPGGVYDRRMIEKHTRVRILFVCTGNTCRSPMAEAIAQSLIAERGAPGLELSAFSAGTSSGSGIAAAPQTVGALKNLGIDPLPHRSRSLTRQMVADADVIYTMSEWHLREVLALDPGAASRAMVLDPTGKDVPDPVGLPQDVYNQTAVRLRELVLARLGELEILAEAT